MHVAVVAEGVGSFGQSHASVGFKARLLSKVEVGSNVPASDG